MTVFNRFGALDTLEEPEELQDTFKREAFEADKKCIGERPRSRSGFTSVETLESRRVALPDLLGTMTSIELCDIGLELS